MRSQADVPAPARPSDGADPRPTDSAGAQSGKGKVFLGKQKPKALCCSAQIHAGGEGGGQSRPFNVAGVGANALQNHGYVGRSVVPRLLGDWRLLVNSCRAWWRVAQCPCSLAYLITRATRGRAAGEGDAQIATGGALLGSLLGGALVGPAPASAAPPPPPQVPAFASAEARRAAGPRGEAWQQLTFPDNLGTIVYNQAGGSLGAHCMHNGHGLCRFNRVLSKRPIGVLIAWLQDGPRHASGADHKARELSYSHTERVAARQWFSGLEGAEECPAREADGSGEDEPDILR